MRNIVLIAILILIAAASYFDLSALINLWCVCVERERERARPRARVFWAHMLHRTSLTLNTHTDTTT